MKSKRSFLTLSLVVGLVTIASLTLQAQKDEKPPAGAANAKVAQSDQKPILERLSDLENQVDQFKKNEQKLSKQLEDLNNQVDQPRKNELVWGEWHFVHTSPDRSGISIDSIQWSSVDSKKIRFRFPRSFDQPPKVHVCVNGMVFTHPMYFVQVDSVDKDGFVLQVGILDKPDVGRKWQHMRLTWFAVPNSDHNKAPEGQVLP